MKKRWGLGIEQRVRIARPVANLSGDTFCAYPVLHFISQAIRVGIDDWLPRAANWRGLFRGT